MRLKRNDTVLDPMTGSGTTNIEASIIGLDSIGVDTNPFCVFMTRVKADALKITKEDLGKFKDVNNLFDFFSKATKAQVTLTEKSAFEFLKKEFDKKPAMRDFFLLCYLDSVAYSKRRKNKTPKDVFPIFYERYMDAREIYLARAKMLACGFNVVPHTC